MRRLLPALILVLLAPLVAELLSGSTPLSEAIALLFVLPIYGAGVLLIRELVVRSGRGWGSILILGAVYGLIEEGLALQSLFNPTLYHASEWGARIFGINGVYTETVLVVHVVWTAAIPILLTELLFPAQRTTSYLHRFGLIVTGICYLFGVVLLWLFFRTSYQVSSILLGLTALIALVLVIVALGVLPGQMPRPTLPIHAPQPRVVLVVTLIATLIWHALLSLLWRVQPAFAQGLLVLVPMLGALIIVVLMIWLVGRWSRSQGWGDRHLLALASGALVVHTAIGALLSHYTLFDRIGVVVLGLIMSGMLALFARRIRGREDDAAQSASREQHQLTV
jgi:hypothetical protein